MHYRFLRPIALILGVAFFLSISLVDADGQSRRRRRPRRVNRPVVTNPPIVAPGEEGASEGEERVISTADEASGVDLTEPSTTQKTRTTTRKTDQEQMRETIDSLSEHVNKLNDKLNKMQENDRTLIDMERLTRAEQRAENLRTQQVDVESKLADLQSKLEAVEYSLKPEIIERAAAGYGSTRPEEAREARRRQLENEKMRLQAQIRILETSRSRLEQSLATADAEVDLLRRRLEQQRLVEAGGSAQTEAAPSNTRRP